MELKAVLLHVDDVPASIAFYRDLMGMRQTDDDPGPGYRPGTDWAMLVAGPVALELFDRRVHGAEGGTTGAPPGVRLLLAFETDDLDAAAARLSAHGADATPIVLHGWGRCVYVSDAEGNRIQVYQAQPAASAGPKEEAHDDATRDR